MLGTITVSSSSSFASYLWSDGSTNQTLSANTAGTYTVTGTDANGCSATDSMLLDILTVDITQNDTTICEGDSLVLSNNISTDSTVINEVWNKLYNSNGTGGFGRAYIHNTCLLYTSPSPRDS